MRAFIGIGISDKLKPKIIEIQNKFSNFDIKFVEPENLHFNLKFFKDLKDVDQLKNILTDISLQLNPFEIKIAGIGAFPSKNYVRVIWLGVKDGYQNLVSLAKIIDTSLERLGVKSEERFVPHLTLGRVRSGKNKNEIKILLKELENIEIGEMKVNEIILFQSNLSPFGPEYKELFKINLKI
ncbi:MAG: RNA 2',3'-cyclic phosphodiesterase [Candidatus Aenigmatarchaeota archaeon]